MSARIVTVSSPRRHCVRAFACVRVRVLVLVLVTLVPVVSGCKKKPKPFPPAPQLFSSAPTGKNAPNAGGVLGSGDAGLVALTPSSLPTVADTMSPADRAAFEQAKLTVADLEGLAKRGVLANPDKPDDADAPTKCGTLEDSRTRLELLADADVKKLVVDSKRLCSLEIPLISADKTLKQVTISPSQASRQLMCKYASKDLDKARKEKPSDRRVRDLDARFTRACR